MKQSLLRYYLYIRRGIGHVGVVLSGFTAVNTFYLVSREYTFLSGLSYPFVMGVGVLVLVPVLLGIGFLDYKRGFFNIECSVHTEENPYAKDLFTAKERDFVLPVSLMAAEVSLRVNGELADKFGLSDGVRESLKGLALAKKHIEDKLKEIEK